MNALDAIAVDIMLTILSPKERDAVVMWYIEDYNLREIADILNDKYNLSGKKFLNPRQVRVIIAKSIEKLRKNSKERGT